MVRGRSVVAAALVAIGVRVLCNAAPCAAQVDFSGIAPAQTVAQAKQRLAQRIERVLDYWASGTRGAFPHKRRHYGRFSWPAAAQLAQGKDVDAINRVLMASKTRPFGSYGTRIRVVPGLCERSGDYDFVAQELLRLVYSDMRRGAGLRPSTLRRVAKHLLREKGGTPRTRFVLGLCGKHRETENHVLMTESSRYLTNQLLRTVGERSDPPVNERSGLGEWIVRRLRRAFVSHFEEYNARPYQGYTVLALSNLHSFAEGPEVAQASRMVLDYLAAVFAVQSNGLRRFPPFRRQLRYEESARVDDHDAETARFALLAGNYDFYERFGQRAPYGAHFMLAAALSDYRVPDAILHLIVDKQHTPYFQRLRHDNVEVYASSPGFLISGGGTFSRHFQFGSSEQHGWARPTVVIPTRDTHVDIRKWLRIEGTQNARKRNNTCVLPGFACGVNLKVPSHIPKACREQHGHYTFLNLAAPACPLDYGFYVAVYREPCDTVRCRMLADNYGFFELRDAAELPFSGFVERVLAENPRSFRSRGVMRYRTSDGRDLQFEPVAGDTERWPVVAIDGVPQRRAFGHWPLAEGDIINARGDGLVTIDSRDWGSRLELDLRDPESPRRRVVRRMPAGARVTLVRRQDSGQ